MVRNIDCLWEDPRTKNRSQDSRCFSTILLSQHFGLLRCSSHADGSDQPAAPKFSGSTLGLAHSRRDDQLSRLARHSPSFTPETSREIGTSGHHTLTTAARGNFIELINVLVPVTSRGVGGEGMPEAPFRGPGKREPDWTC